MGRLIPANSTWHDRVMIYAEYFAEITTTITWGQVTPLTQRVHDGFLPFTAGDDEAADLMRQSFEDASMQVGSHAPQSLSSAATDIADWHGTAADNFEAYLNNMHAAVLRQGEALEAVAIVMKAYQALLLAVRSDLLDLVGQADGGLAAAAEDDEMQGWKVGSAVVGVFSSTVGGAHETAFGDGAALGFLSGIGSVIIELGDGGENEGDVMQRLADGLEGLRRLYEEQLAALEQGLRNILDELLNKPHLPDVNPEPPTIATRANFDPREFNLGSDQSEEINKKVDTGPLVPDDGIGKTGAGVGKGR
jgi:hypothetical protein